MNQTYAGNNRYKRPDAGTDNYERKINAQENERPA